MEKRTLLLVNNKDKEPNFIKSFSRSASKTGVDFQSIRATDFSYFYNRSTGLVEILLHGVTIDPATHIWFIRRWSPSEDATALLCVLLKEMKIDHTDSKINSTHEIRTSKLSQTFQLALNGCPSPSTFVCHINHVNKLLPSIKEKITFPLVLKTRGGSGKRVWLCKTQADLKRKIKELRNEAKDSLVIIQEMIENDYDIRVTVYKGQILASIQRYNEDNFLNNVSQGGTAIKVTLSKSEARLAIKAAKTIGLDLAGVDLVRTSDQQTLLFEVNKAPDITSFNTAAQKDLAKSIADILLDSK